MLSMMIAFSKEDLCFQHCKNWTMPSARKICASSIVKIGPWLLRCRLQQTHTHTHARIIVNLNSAHLGRTKKKTKWPQTALSSCQLKGFRFLSLSVQQSR